MASGSSRYTVRALPKGGGHYCVWDSEKNAVASSSDGARQYDDMSMQEAFDAVDELVEQGEVGPEGHGPK